MLQYFNMKFYCSVMFYTWACLLYIIICILCIEKRHNLRICRYSRTIMKRMHFDEIWVDTSRWISILHYTQTVDNLYVEYFVFLARLVIKFVTKYRPVSDYLQSHNNVKTKDDNTNLYLKVELAYTLTQSQQNK